MPQPGIVPFVRKLFTVPVLFAAAMALCQQGGQPKPFASVRPDVMIVVRKHATGGDLVEVSVLHPDYPSELLQRQILAIGGYLGSPVNGLALRKDQIDPGKPELAFLKGSCGTFGLWNKDQGTVRLDALVKAFVGAPEPYAAKGLSIMFVGLIPQVSTLRKLENDSITLEASENKDPQGVEYRIGLKTQDAQKVEIPTGKPERKAPEKPSKGQATLPVFVWAAIGAAGVAAGVLVYLALLRGRRPAG